MANDLSPESEQAWSHKDHQYIVHDRGALVTGLGGQATCHWQEQSATGDNCNGES